MTKTIFLADIHGPMTDEQKKLYNEASKNTVILRGDVIDRGGPINTEILNQIPVVSIQEMMKSLYQPHSWDPPRILSGKQRRK